MGEVESDYDGGVTKGHPPAKKPDMSSFSDTIRNSLDKILPILLKLEDGAEWAYRTALPYVNQGIKAYKELMKILEPYGVNEIAQCVTGFAMMFFGGFFITTVAVHEAIQQGGYENLSSQLKIIYAEFSKFKDANKSDDLADEDGDGIADVEQISSSEYGVRKALLALRSTDPNKLSSALQSLYGILLAVIATLQLQFARTISLGASIGDQLNEIMDKFIIPTVDDYIDDEYHKWLPVAGRYLSRLIGITIAFQIQRILSTFHTAVKGARVFTRGLTNLSVRNGYSYLTDGYLDEALSGLLSVTGIYLQLFAWNSLPIIMRLLFFPAFFVESLLSMFVNTALTFTSVDASATAA
eukprot:augustus_masked-scaffold_3-processed-gene-8.6-mRNA-1 protein AED:0.01 eAED:0.01 QI:0/-1/0/1/-1/1/1/0/353